MEGPTRASRVFPPPAGSPEEVGPQAQEEGWKRGLPLLPSRSALGPCRHRDRDARSGEDDPLRRPTGACYTGADEGSRRSRAQGRRWGEETRKVGRVSSTTATAAAAATTSAPTTYGPSRRNESLGRRPKRPSSPTRKKKERNPKISFLFL